MADNWKCTVIAALLVVLVVASFFGENNSGLDVITTITTIATVIEAGAVVCALVLAYEVRESIKTRHFEGMAYVRNLIGTKKAANQRRWVYQELRKKGWPLSDEDQERAQSVCRDFDHIGLLCRKDLLPREIIAETYNRNILDMWKRLERFVKQWRVEKKDEDYYWEFEWLAKQAQAAEDRLQKQRRKAKHPREDDAQERM